jgi:hypothetical protein
MNDKSLNMRGWRKLMAVAGASATQAFADPGDTGSTKTTSVLKASGGVLHQAGTQHAKRTSVLKASGGLVEQSGTDQAAVSKKGDKHQKDGKSLSGLEALQESLTAVAPGGSTSDVSAMSYEGDGADAYAKGALTFAVGDGAADASVIQLTHYRATKGSEESFKELCATQVNCQVTDLSDGSVLVSYDVPFGKGQTGGTNLGAARLVDGYVVALWVQVPVDEHGKVLDPSTVLTMDQLEDVLSQPQWADLKQL